MEAEEQPLCYVPTDGWTTGDVTMVLCALIVVGFVSVSIVIALTSPKPLGQEPPAVLAEMLSGTLSETTAMDSPYLTRVLDALFQNALATGLISSAPPPPQAAAGEPPPAPAAQMRARIPPERLVVVEQVVPLLYVALQRYAADVHVVTSAFTVLSAIAPLEGGDLTTARIMYRPGSVAIRIAALRQHTRDVKAAHYGTLSIGMAIIAGGLLPLPSPLPTQEELRGAAEVALMCARAHPDDSEVVLWSLSCLLHAGACAVTDESSRPVEELPCTDDAEVPKPRPPSIAVLPMDGDAKVGPFNTRPYTLAGWLGDNGAAAVIVAAMRRFPDVERIASVGVLALGVLVKSRADNWAGLLMCDAFGAVRSAVTRHNGLKGADRVHDVAAALVLIEAAMLLSISSPRAAIRERDGAAEAKAEDKAASTLRRRT